MLQNINSINSIFFITRTGLIYHVGLNFYGYYKYSQVEYINFFIIRRFLKNQIVIVRIR
jgi:hypothetical protein